MTDNEKLIETINRYLPKLNEKRLRLVLTMLYKFTDSNTQKQEATGDTAE